MTNLETSAHRKLRGPERAFLIGTSVWIALQVSRAVAFVLIDDINAGLASQAWRYPALLDLFAVAFAVPLIWAVWARRGLLTWAALIVYWAISIVDHIGNSSPRPLSGRHPSQRGWPIPP